MVERYTILGQVSQFAPHLKMTTGVDEDCVFGGGHCPRIQIMQSLPANFDWSDERTTVGTSDMYEAGRKHDLWKSIILEVAA